MWGKWSLPIKARLSVFQMRHYCINVAAVRGTKISDKCVFVGRSPGTGNPRITRELVDGVCTCVGKGPLAKAAATICVALGDF